MDASPCPLALELGIDTQFVFVAIDQPQSRVAEIASEPLPPASVNVDGVLLT